MLSKLTHLLFAFCISCNQDLAEKVETKTNFGNSENPYKTINDIPLPAGFKRIKNTKGSFGEWLNNVALKKDKSVYKFDGTLKHDQTVQFAVLDFSIGKKDLQQCADAVMRLKAEFLYEKNDFDKISFKDNNGKSYRYGQPYSRRNFDKYLERVFGMCGSASLEKELKENVTLEDVKPGDVLIRGGFPGHAAIVMGVGRNDQGKKIFLLAQSYMPAQDIYVLINPSNKKLSPWYEVNDDKIIKTPEYNFTRWEVKRW